jgi:hypothetical protein
LVIWEILICGHIEEVGLMKGFMAIGINMTLIVEWFNIRYMRKSLRGNNMGFRARINMEHMSEWFTTGNIWEISIVGLKGLCSRRFICWT